MVKKIVTKVCTNIVLIYRVSVVVFRFFYFSYKKTKCCRYREKYVNRNSCKFITNKFYLYLVDTLPTYKIDEKTKLNT